MGTGFELPGEGSAVAAGDERPVVPRPTFGSVRRGYDPSEVDAFLAEVASIIHTLQARSRDTARDDGPADISDRLTERFARIVAVQEQEVERLLTEAHAEADSVVAEARREAERTRREARDAAQRSVEDADAFRARAAVEADDLRSGLAERRRAMIEELPQIQQRLRTFLRDLEVTLGSLADPDEE